MEIRKADKEKDYDAVWNIFQAVIASEDTYVFKKETPKRDLEKHWFADYMNTFVGEIENEICGTYILKPNQIDLGNHIANCSYMVHPDFQGQGIGSKLCQHSIEFAKKAGFLGIQFNLVISTNQNAIKLWKKFGFEITGTAKNAFRHSKLGIVDGYIMFKNLD